MTGISLSQLLANTASFLVCASMLGAFFMRYAKAIGGTEIDAKIADFEEKKLSPALSLIDKQLRALADNAQQYAAVSYSVRSLEAANIELTKTVNTNAEQHRKDITGMGQRLEDKFADSMKAQTGALQSQMSVIVKLIEARK